MKEPAIVALTPQGIALGSRLAQALGRGEVLSTGGNIRQCLQDVFQAGRPLVCVMALGIVVRLLGPLTRDKQTEAPVVVVDEGGTFAISVLGGHAAGANVLAKQVATALGAVPVITTASDVLGVPAVDLIGQEWGWQIEHRENLTKVAAAVVRGEAIGVYQDAGRRDWWQPFGPWPSTFKLLESWPPAGALGGNARHQRPGVTRPRSVAGRGVSAAVAGGGHWLPPRSSVFRDRRVVPGHLSDAQHFVPSSLGLVATVSLKSDEPGLQEFVLRHRITMMCFSPEMLAGIGPLPTPSEKVLAKIGIAGVAEPAAMLAAGTNRLLLNKVRGKRVTMALARREA